MCEHDQEMRDSYEGFTAPNFCGENAPHDPHGNCMGIMCDYGCNENGQFFTSIVLTN